MTEALAGAEGLAVAERAAVAERGAGAETLGAVGGGVPVGVTARPAVHLAPDVLAGALALPAPPVGEAVDEFQAAPAGVVTAGVPGRRGAVAGVGHLDPYRAGVVAVGVRQADPQHGRGTGVHHGVGDEFGDQQEQRLGHRFIGRYPRAQQPGAGPPAGPAHLGGVREDIGLHLKHLHRSHHPNRRTHRLAPPRRHVL
ncbi:hypothetical protein SCATT_23600 [Streptantibioticus cattleyicolor NRRL 8057 = DSM 46488]|uniref:Uncharacterized protein n=1 Tax=Streptantibioticus cattleyicolor (strain ATCC 35852 / DSM 46488 / JCM 4925 / NBRC 14057 / NRRL 8057) TaxID=1003195 RepID=G8WRX1_STREN|nr:hypothetical protein SCATT_23600 [Streptantibioticus cattleyicolor NRRL 8057 = DSM 46488]